jgi:antitoxin VapB
MHREGDRLVIVPVRKRGLAVLLDSWQPLTETLPEVEVEDEVVDVDEIF